MRIAYRIIYGALLASALATVAAYTFGDQVLYIPVRVLAACGAVALLAWLVEPLTW